MKAAASIPGVSRTESLPRRIRIGCAGWSVSGRAVHEFPPPGTHLERYARRFAAVEINSSFYRPHKPHTYARWAESVPDDFRFSVKIPKTITHERRLSDAREPLEQFLTETGALGEKLGALLVQLPPKLELDVSVARSFFEMLRALHDGPVVLEPRHVTWFGDAASDLLTAVRVSRAAADPAVVPDAAVPGAFAGLAYYRLHGSPRMYFSEYSPAYLEDLARQLVNGAHRETWCIFDNTGGGAALPNAVTLAKLIG